MPLGCGRHWLLYVVRAAALPWQLPGRLLMRLQALCRTRSPQAALLLLLGISVSSSTSLLPSSCRQPYDSCCCILRGCCCCHLHIHLTSLTGHSSSTACWCCLLLPQRLHLGPQLPQSCLAPLLLSQQQRQAHLGLTALRLFLVCLLLQRC